MNAIDLQPPLPVNEDGDPVVDLDEPEEGSEDTIVYDEDAPNLVESFILTEAGKKKLEEIGQDVTDKFDEDWDGSDAYRKRVARDLVMFTGDLPPKPFPWENCANIHVPILMENLLRLSCRIESEIFPAGANVFGVMPVGPDDEDVAALLTIHGNWQIRERIPDFERQMARMIQQFLLVGDVTVHSYWSALDEQNCHDVLSPDEFVTPFTFVSVKPDYGDLPHYCKVLRYYRHQLQAYTDRWVGVEEVLEGLPPSWGDDPEMPAREEMASVQGETIPTDLSKGAPYVLLQWEGWMELPMQKRDRFVQVIVDKSTKTVLSLKIHEEASWQERARFEKQSAEMGMYIQAKGQHDAQIQALAQQGQMAASLAAEGQLGEQQTAMLGHTLEQAIPPPPPPPSWLQHPEDLSAGPAAPKKVPILMFAHAVCIEPMMGSLGLGVGRILADYNRSANIAINQFTDAATLANASGLITADTVDFDRPFSWAPGVINKASGVSGAELKNAIMPMQTQPGNGQLIQLVQMMQQYGQAAAQSPDVLSGQAGKSGETYRGIATRIEQATKQLTIFGKRIARLVRTVLENNGRLNAIFLSDDEIQAVLQEVAIQMAPVPQAPPMLMPGMPIPPPPPAPPPLPPLTKELYQRGYKVEIRSDLQFTSDAERTQEADQVLQMTQAFQPLMNDVSFFWQACKRALEVRRRKDMIARLGPDPGPPQTPFGLPPPMPPGMPPPGGPPPGQQPGPPQAPGEQGGGPPAPTGPGGPVPQAA